jgi:hypothetical protein
MIGNDQQRASISSYAGLARNPDGSIDLHFGPAAPHGAVSNWAQTIPSQGLLRHVPPARTRSTALGNSATSSPTPSTRRPAGLNHALKAAAA